MQSSIEMKKVFEPKFIAQGATWFHRPDAATLKLRIGKYIYRHKGKRAKNRPNYPPLPVKPKTGRKNQTAIRGIRRLMNLPLQAQIYGSAHGEPACKALDRLIEKNPATKRLEQIRERHKTSFLITKD